MATEIYEIPDSVTDLFKEVMENDGGMSYRIINYSEGMSMDNNDALVHFVESVDISEEFIEEDLGTQLTLIHPDFEKKIIIDSGGLGDFFSHGFDCYVEEQESEVTG